MDTQEAALTIVKTLVDSGELAYYAGGRVRDRILGSPSDDIDIATSAHPEKVMELFPRTVAVGVSFGVVIVVMEDKQFEVATFRSDHAYVDGRRPEGVTFSTPQEDAMRRDFTINGMFFDPLTETLHDFVGGREDLEKGRVQTIGSPIERFTEDRLRMVRAVRFAVRFGFTLDRETEEAITNLAHSLLPSVSMERIWEELRKMVKDGHFTQAVLELHRLGLLSEIFPLLQGIERKELEERIQPLEAFPKHGPPILFVMELFPDRSVDELENLCRYLKGGNKDSKLLAFVSEGRELVGKEGQVENVDWARFYAHPQSELCLEVIAARRSLKEREAFYSLHHKRRGELSSHVERMQQGRPLVTSQHLRDEGISPGKKMGELLYEAERISVNRDFNDCEIVLDKLKDSSLWPKK